MRVGDFVEAIGLRGELEVEKKALGFDGSWPWRYVLCVYCKCATFLRADYGVETDGDNRVRKWRDCLGGASAAAPQVDSDAPTLVQQETDATTFATVDFAEARTGRGLRLAHVSSVAVGALLVVASANGDSTIADGGAGERFELCHGYPTDGNRHQPRICFTASNAGDPPMRALWGATRSTGSRHVYTVVFGHKSWKRRHVVTPPRTHRSHTGRWSSSEPSAHSSLLAAASAPSSEGALRGRGLARRVPFLLRSNSTNEYANPVAAAQTQNLAAAPRASRARRVPTPSSSYMHQRVVTSLLGGVGASSSTRRRRSNRGDLLRYDVDDDGHHLQDDDDDDDLSSNDDDDDTTSQQRRDDLDDDEEDDDETVVVAEDDDDEETRNPRASSSKRSAALFVDSTIEGCADVGQNTVAAGLTIGSDRNGAYRLKGDVAVFALWKGHTPASCLMAIENALIKKYRIDTRTPQKKTAASRHGRPRSGTA